MSSANHERIGQIAAHLRRNPNDLEAWLLLAELLDDPAKKRDCYVQVLRIFPNHPLAVRRILEIDSEEQSNSERASLSLAPRDGELKAYEVLQKQGFSRYKSWWWIVAVLVGSAMLMCILLPTLSGADRNAPTSRDMDSNPRVSLEDEAFSYATTFALQEMYAANPTYACGGGVDPRKPTVEWYKLRVEPRGGETFFVVGAMKAIDSGCVYEKGYFAATMKRENGVWEVVGRIVFSNPCQTVTTLDDYQDKVVCDLWRPGWRPDPSWSPP